MQDIILKIEGKTTPQELVEVLRDMADRIETYSSLYTDEYVENDLVIDSEVI